VSWPQPQRLREVHLTFDNLAAQRHEYPWESGSRVLPMLVKVYELACWDGSDWRTLAREECNYHRFRRHPFAPLTSDKLRLRIIETHGGTGVARVYQVRVL
jgi:hypothetical protein